MFKTYTTILCSIITLGFLSNVSASDLSVTDLSHNLSKDVSNKISSLDMILKDKDLDLSQKVSSLDTIIKNKNLDLSNTESFDLSNTESFDLSNTESFDSSDEKYDMNTKPVLPKPINVRKLDEEVSSDKNTDFWTTLINGVNTYIDWLEKVFQLTSFLIGSLSTMMASLLCWSCTKYRSFYAWLRSCNCTFFKRVSSVCGRKPILPVHTTRNSKGISESRKTVQTYRSQQKKTTTLPVQKTVPVRGVSARRAKSSRV